MSGLDESLPDPMLLMSPDGRFAIVTRECLMALVVPVSSVEDIPTAMSRAVSMLTWLSEEEARLQLAGLGMNETATDAHIDSARRRLLVWSSQATVMERMTKAGYRNADGQEVVGPTDARAGDQRIFVMRCGVCGHQYGGYGCDVDIRRCPACQDGLPGRPIDVPGV
jgi:hypothetical protein